MDDGGLQTCQLLSQASMRDQWSSKGSLYNPKVQKYQNATCEYKTHFVPRQKMPKKTVTLEFKRAATKNFSFRTKNKSVSSFQNNYTREAKDSLSEAKLVKFDTQSA